MSDMELYSRYFPVGKRVWVCIPLPKAKVFKDWAIINEIDEDLVSLQLSRDVLPVELELQFGQILELRCGTGGSGYCCRAIVVSEGDASNLLLRLIGEIVSDELREFYRIDAFLPIKYFVSHEQNIDQLHLQWEKRRIQRQRQKFEINSNTPRWPGGLLHSNTVLPHERHTSSIPGEQSGESDDSWDTIIPLAANISGGGLRTITHQGFEEGEYMLLEILVPLPQRMIDVVGRVVFANRNYAAGNDREYFNTGVQFVYIDKHDRDAIVNYITTIQLKRIQKLRERYLDQDVLEKDRQLGRFGGKFAAGTWFLILLGVIMIMLLVDYFWHYADEHPKGEIQKIFEDGVKKYRERM